MRYISGAQSDVGRVRGNNEDAYLLDEPLFVVADGMGGHLAGDVAARTAISVIADAKKAGEAESDRNLTEIVRRANAAIWKQAQGDASLNGMGTTCTLLMLADETGYIAHVGDSRAYLLRDGELKQLTEDHTLVQRMVREGKLRPEDADRHPQRSIITRALGVDSDVQVDTDAMRLREGDRLLLCSDGLSSMVDTDEIRTALEGAEDPQSAADALVALANEAGGEDNVTVIVVDVADGAEERAVTEASTRPVDADERRVSTEPGPHPESRALTIAPGRRRRRIRRGVKLLALLGLAAAAAYFGIAYLLTNSWFVGVNQDGFVAIYEGIPEDVLGFSFKEELDVSDTQLASLPVFVRDDVESGIKANSLDDAENKVAELQAKAEEFERFRSAPREQRKS